MDNYTRLSGYSLMFSVMGAVMYLIAFPSGIYSGFVLGAIGTAGGFLSRPYTEKKLFAILAIIVGIIDLAICMLAFHGLHSLYSMLNDPIYGPQITSFITDLLEQYNVSLDTFVTLMHQ